jgi:hypothetical protein
MNEIKPEYFDFLNTVQEDLAVPIMKETYESRNPAGWIKHLGGSNAWSNREAEWFMAEKRMLFGCSNEMECDRWVTILNWMIYQKRGK